MFLSDNDAGTITLKALVTELEHVRDWFHLGVYLEVPEADLMAISYKHETSRNLKAIKSDLFTAWMKSCAQPTWSAVVKALVGVQMEPLAKKLGLRYGKNYIIATVSTSAMSYTNLIVPTLCVSEKVKFRYPVQVYTLHIVTYVRALLSGVAKPPIGSLQCVTSWSFHCTVCTRGSCATCQRISDTSMAPVYIGTGNKLHVTVRDGQVLSCNIPRTNTD